MVGSACSETAIEQSQPINQLISENDHEILAEGMVVFEGSVFVASTNPLPDCWRMAGWQIASKSTAISDDQVPMDCTLYPHRGVENQWIGSCFGNTSIPEDGASHIAVMHTPPDGNTILVQVAPTPDSIGP
jgi:hypothetical protein